jgi:hypothetical protein
MTLTERLYAKAQGSVNAAPDPTPSATVTPTPSVTPSISITPTVTPSISITPTVTPSISVTPTITPSTSVATYYYLANVYNCTRDNTNQLVCGQFAGQTVIADGVIGTGAFTLEQYYSGSANTVYQPIGLSTTYSASVIVANEVSFSNCALACSASLV